MMMVSPTSLQLELVPAYTIAINSTFERDISDENFTGEEFKATMIRNVAFREVRCNTGKSSDNGRIQQMNLRDVVIQLK